MTSTIHDGLTQSGRGLASNGFWTFTTQVASRVAILVVLVIAARCLPLALFGSFAVVQSTVLLAVSIWDFGFSTMAVRDISRNEMTISQATNGMLNGRLVSLPIVSLCLLLTFYLLVPTNLLFPASCIFFLLALVNAAVLFLSAVAQSQLTFRLWCDAVVAGRFVTMVIAPISFMVTPNTAFMVLASALLVGDAVTLFVLFRRQRSHISLKRTDLKIRHGICALRSSAPYMLNSAMNLIYNRMDILIVAAFAGSAQAAVYAPASRIQDAFMIVPATFSTVVLPTIGRRFADNASTAGSLHLTWWSSFACGLFGMIIVAGTYLLAPLAPAVLGASFDGSVQAIRIIILSIVFISIATPCFAAVLSLRGARTLNYAFGGAFCVAMLGHLLLTSRYGSIGAAWVAVIRDAVGCFIGLGLLLRISRQSMSESGKRATWTTP